VLRRSVDEIEASACQQHTDDSRAARSIRRDAGVASRLIWKQWICSPGSRRFVCLRGESMNRLWRMWVLQVCTAVYTPAPPWSCSAGFCVERSRTPHCFNRLGNDAAASPADPMRAGENSALCVGSYRNWSATKGKYEQQLPTPKAFKRSPSRRTESLVNPRITVLVVVLVLAVSLVVHGAFRRRRLHQIEKRSICLDDSPKAPVQRCHSLREYVVHIGTHWH